MDNIMKKLNDFTGLYSLNKTLRFELQPVGETADKIKEAGILKDDEYRANNYEAVKKIIDKYHRSFIERVLSGFTFICESSNKENSLEEFYNFYTSTIRDEKKFRTIRSNLRKQIVTAFNEDKDFALLFKKDFIKKVLMEFVETKEEQLLIKKFERDTTFFKRFNVKRKNIYSADAKHTTIVYRLIHDNLPRFIDNISRFNKLVNCLGLDELQILCADLKNSLGVRDISNLFELKYYNQVLTQGQIDVYNKIIGGVNKYVNTYNQSQKNRSACLPKLNFLFKQILSEKETISWLPEQFESDNALLASVRNAYQELYIKNKSDLVRLLSNLPEYDLDKIYIKNDDQLSRISKNMFGRSDTIQEALKKELRNTSRKKKDESRIEKEFQKRQSIPIGYINRCLSTEGTETKKIEEYFRECGVTHEDEKSLWNQVEDAYAKVCDLLESAYPQDKTLITDDINIENIKVLLDALKRIQLFVKPLLGNGDETEKDERFYGDFVAVCDTLNEITPLYNRVRNYLTRKPYSKDKIKLIFGESQLLNGWDLNKEQTCKSVIFRKGELFYLGIMNKKYNKILEVKNEQSDGDCYEKMELKSFGESFRRIPKSSVAMNEVKTHFDKSEKDYVLDNKKNFLLPLYISKEIYDLGKGGVLDNLRKIEDHEIRRKKLNLWINFCIDFLEKYKSTSIYDVKNLKNKDYEDVNDFYNDVDHICYRITFRNVSVQYIDSLVSDGKLYLFKIHNKDFEPSSKGTPNMHTLYWRMLFDERNLSDVVYQLNGGAEVFFRKASLERRITHPANRPINNKNKNNSKRQSIFKYDLIKDKRYTIDKYLFHVPITLNFNSLNDSDLNTSVQEYIRKSNDLHIIGIDRGERNLVYISVIDLYGNIKAQYSLNEIKNSYLSYSTDYHDLLLNRERERQEARSGWKAIKNIKDLKEGYLSQVVHVIAELMLEYNAIVVLEKLNKGFYRGRQKVEMSVYAKFEKMLIDKLSYYVNKKKNPEDVGGLLNALQLTNKDIDEKSSQNGFLFYVRPQYTSKIDPVTGFVDLFKVQYENKEKAKQFFESFDFIRYNKEKDWFEFSFDYEHFPTKGKCARTSWTVCTHGSRIRSTKSMTKNGHWSSEEIILTEEFKRHFEHYGIDWNFDLKDAILAQEDSSFFKDLLSLFKLTLQLRNSRSDVDYIVSPVINENGDRCYDEFLPKDGDANGAYNIARKGLYLVRKIKESNSLDCLSIEDKEWFDFAQKRPYLKI